MSIERKRVSSAAPSERLVPNHSLKQPQRPADLSMYSKFANNAAAAPPSPVRSSDDPFAPSLQPLKKSIINVESYELPSNKSNQIQAHPTQSDTASAMALSVLSVPTNSAKAIQQLTGLKVDPPREALRPSPDSPPATSPLRPARTRSSKTFVGNHLDDNRPQSAISDADEPPRPMSAPGGMRSNRFESNASTIDGYPADSRPSKLSFASSMPTVRNSSVAPRPFPIAQGNHAGANTLGCLYIVSGLPKDPFQWSIVDETPDNLPAHVDGAVQRFFKAEVLGTSVVGERLMPDMNELDSDLRKAGKKRKPTKTSTVTKGASELTSDEVAKITSKAVKLAFPKECEVVASTLSPTAQASYYSFVLPNTAAASPKVANGGQAFNVFVQSTTTRQSLSSEEVTYYAANLTIWTHADRHRASAIRKALSTGKHKELAKALKAASLGRKFSKRLETTLARGNLTGSVLNLAETDQETDAFQSETEIDLPVAVAPAKDRDLPLWLPYSLTLVSRFPIYDIMLDTIRVSYARFHTEIAQHSLAMSNFLNQPAPRLGEELKVSAGSDDVKFVARMPGLSDLQRETQVETNTTVWPLFAALSADHLLTICEHALSPLGRVVFISQFPILMSMAVETIKYILELRGWAGDSHHTCHARDIKLLLEDPGPYIIAFHSSCRGLSLDAPPEVLFVDVDSDRLECQSYHSESMSKGPLREKNVKRLEAAIDRPSNVTSVPREFMEAFPSGRFRPLSSVLAGGRMTDVERLLPPPSWNFDSNRVISAFDAILSRTQNTGFMAMFRKTKPRRIAILDPSTLHVQSIMRRHASQFIDRRDFLEGRIGKLNRRLAYLVSESQAWKTQHEIFQNFAKSLSTEAQELKTRLEKERREAKRLSNVVSEQQTSHQKLAKRLEETEAAKAQAAAELDKVAQIRAQLELQHTEMLSELSAIMTPDIGLASLQLHHASLATPLDSRLGTRSVSPSSMRPRKRTPSFTSTTSSAHPNFYDSDEDDGASIIEDAGARDALQAVQARLQAVLKRAGAISPLPEIEVLSSDVSQAAGGDSTTDPETKPLARSPVKITRNGKATARISSVSPNDEFVSAADDSDRSSSDGSRRTHRNSKATANSDRTLVDSPVDNRIKI